MQSGFFQPTYRRLIGMALAVLLMAAAAVQAAETLTDETIGNAVDRELIADSAIPADAILVSAVNGIVTLSGSVDNLLARDRAVAVAETVRGVRGIVNRIEVVPPARSDTQIRENIQDALLWDPATESFEISVVVADGVVTLSGEVDSWQERRLAAMVAKGVKGVVEIDNDIMVAYAMERNDAEIKEEVEAALRWDAYVDDALIDVTVDDAAVTLNGIVGSMAEKTRARVDAWVAGVASVDHTDLQIKYWARDERLRANKYVVKSDAEIETAVKDVLYYDPRVSASDVSVEMDNGVATLRGTVDGLKEKRAAATDARNVVGVWTVKNRIKVVPQTPPSDDRIESSIENALVRDPYLDRYQISVAVFSGDVYLYGDVDTSFEKTRADDVAARQRGVKAVHNFLRVHSPGTTLYDAYTDDWDRNAYDWSDPDDITVRKTDWEIEADINDELFWSPYVDSDQVNVEVNDGVARLTGNVDTWAEREAAQNNTLEGGAIAVDNDLTVDFGPTYYRAPSS